MQHFVGTKTVSAKPMTRAEFVAYRYPNQPHNPDAGNPEDPGYLVEYHDGGAPNHPAHKGYISWSPKEVFDAAYIVIPGNVNHFPAHVQRVAAEKAQLDDKIDKLEAFTKTEVFASLPNVDVGRLVAQLSFMNGYAETLGDRLKAAGVGIAQDGEQIHRVGQSPI